MHEPYAKDAADLGTAFADLFQNAGGVDLSRRAEAQPDSREQVGELLERFGTWDIAALADPEQALFAAVLCEQAGGLNLPYPVAERLSATGLHHADAVCVVDRHTPLLGHGRLGLRWAGIVDGQLFALREAEDGRHSRIAPFAADASIDGVLDESQTREREALSLLLTSFTLLGMCEAASRKTYDYTMARHQFGVPVASFQGIRFSLTDVATALLGTRELGQYALWSFTQRREDMVADALVFRIAALEAADVTFSRCHQAYGATGLCDETDLSWYSRHSRVLRHAPWGISRTERRLLEESGTAAVSGPFD